MEATQLDNLIMDEVSGVATPANDGEGGWLVLKSAGADTLASYLTEVTKAGRAISGARMDRLQVALAGAEAAHQHLADLIHDHNSDGEKPDEVAAREAAAAEGGKPPANAKPEGGGAPTKPGAKADEESPTEDNAEPGEEPGDKPGAPAGPPRLMGQPITAENAKPEAKPDGENDKPDDNKPENKDKGKQMPEATKPTRKFTDEEASALPASVVEYIEAVEKSLTDNDTALATLTTEVETLKAAADGAAEGDDKTPIEKALEAVPADARPLIAELVEKAVKADETIAAERNIRRDAEFVAVVKAWDGLTIDADKFGPQMRALTDTAPELATEVTRILKAANEAVTQSALFAEIGHAKTPSAGNSVVAEINAKAADLVSKSTDGLTKEAAFTAVLDADPALYQRYLAES